MALITAVTTATNIDSAWGNAVKDGLNTGVLSGTYTPTLGNFAIGTGGSATNSANYYYTGGVLHCTGVIIFGTTGSTLPGAGHMNIYLPTGFTANPAAAQNPGGNAAITIGANTYSGLTWYNGTNYMRLVAQTVSGSSLLITATSGTVPGTWAAGSQIVWNYITPASYA